MAKYLLGILTGVLLAFFLGLAAVIIVLVATTGAQRPQIAEDSVLEIRLAGGLPENIPTQIDFNFLESGPPMTVLGLRETLHEAADDDRVQALVLHCGGLEAGWAKVQEIRWAIERFKASGKPVFAYMQVAGMGDYMIATAADAIYMAPEGVLDVKGLRAEISFYKETLEKLGVEPEFERIGRYKSATEPFARSEMSEAFREVTNSILDELFKNLGVTIAESRQLEPEQVLEAINHAPLLPEAALEYGFVDELIYRDQLQERIQQRLEIDEYTSLGLPEYRFYTRQVEGLPLGGGGGKHIAVVYGVGSILRGRAGSDPFFGAEIIGSESFNEMLAQVRDNDDVQAVILRINSPGGDAMASDEIWRGLQLLAEEKPVVVSMSDVAASGGYYMAMAEETPVLAYPGTFTGSIGVYFGKFSLRDLYQKIGLKKEILTRGRFADIYTDYRPLTPTERRKLQQGIEKVYATFVSKVADARETEWEEIDKVARGRVWLGSQARHVNLVDELGGFDRAIELAKERAGIGADEEIRLRTYPAAKSLLQLILEQNIGVTQAPLFPAKWARKLDPAGALPALAEGGFLAISPYSLEIQ